MVRVYLRLSAIAVTALLTACAPLEWRKDGAGAAAKERDLTECQNDARQRARLEAPLFGQAQPPPIGMDSRGRVVTGRAGSYDTERALLEHDLTRACMHERGYKLEPVEKQ